MKKSVKRTTITPSKPKPRRLQVGSSYPPRHVQQPIRSWMVRTTVSSGGGILNQFSGNQLARILGIVATSATTSSFFTTQFRLNKVEMWSVPTVTGVPVTIEAKWADSPLAASIGIANPPQSVEDTSESSDRPAHVMLKPKRGTLGDNWFGVATTTVLLLLSAPADTIIDFHYSFIIDDVGTTVAGPTLVAATTGVIYHSIVTGTAGTGSLTITAVEPLNSI